MLLLKLDNINKRATRTQKRGKKTVRRQAEEGDTQKTLRRQAAQPSVKKKQENTAPTSKSTQATGCRSYRPSPRTQYAAATTCRTAFSMFFFTKKLIYFRWFFHRNL
jgi:hypothetical protein